MKWINFKKTGLGGENLRRIGKAAFGLSIIFILGFSFKKLLETVSPRAKIDRSADLTSTASYSAFTDGNYTKAIDELAQAIRLDTVNGVAYVVRGRVYLLMKAYSEALKDFDKAMKLGELNSEVYLYRAQVYYAIEDYAGAFADYSRSIEYLPNTDAYAGKGDVYLKMNNPREAVASYTKAIELSPENPEVYFARGKAYNSQAMYEMALSDFEEAIRLDPSGEIYKRSRDFAIELMNLNHREKNF